MNKSQYTLSVVALAIALGGCSGAVNGSEQALTIAQQHPIAVDSQVVSMTIKDDGTTDDISAVDKSRLNAFADSYLRYGHGPLTITAPSGSENDLDSQEAAADIRQHLNNIGVPWSSMTGASYRSGAAGDRDMILSYTHYVATPSACGIWDGLRESDRRNIRSPNFGCSTMNNLAAMIADPRDLVAPTAMTAPDAAIRIRGVNAFRAGEDTSSEGNDEIEQQIANQ